LILAETGHFQGRDETLLPHLLSIRLAGDFSFPVTNASSTRRVPFLAPVFDQRRGKKRQADAQARQARNHPV
jgi:hypothetical protein